MTFDAELIQIMKQYFLLLNGKRAMTDNLDLATHELRWSDAKFKRYSSGDKQGVRLVSLDELSYRDLWVGLLSANIFQLPVTEPASPLMGSIWYESAADILWLYGGFPPNWHAH